MNALKSDSCVTYPVAQFYISACVPVCVMCLATKHPLIGRSNTAPNTIIPLLITPFNYNRDSDHILQ